MHNPILQMLNMFNIVHIWSGVLHTKMDIVCKTPGFSHKNIYIDIRRSSVWLCSYTFIIAYIQYSTQVSCSIQCTNCGKNQSFCVNITRVPVVPTERRDDAHDECYTKGIEMEHKLENKIK